MKLNDSWGFSKSDSTVRSLLAIYWLGGCTGLGRPRLDLSHPELQGRWCPTVADPGFLVGGC